jgi:DNA-binding NarL/FixJ family response regulator
VTAGLRPDPWSGIDILAPQPQPQPQRGVEHARTVLLAMPDAPLRDGLAGRFSSATPVAFLRAATLPDAVDLATAHGPGDLAVVDLALCDDDPDAVVRFVATLRSGGWEHVVACGDGGSLDSVGAVLRAGARGCLFGADPAPVPERRGVLAPLAHIHVLDAAGRERALSGLEVEVLRLAADGLGNPEIGRVLGLSALTVKSHLTRVVHRLAARDRAHLVLLALRSGAIR